MRLTGFLKTLSLPANDSCDSSALPTSVVRSWLESSKTKTSWILSQIGRGMRCSTLWSVDSALYATTRMPIFFDMVLSAAPAARGQAKHGPGVAGGNAPFLAENARRRDFEPPPPRHSLSDVRPAG